MKKPTNQVSTRAETTTKQINNRDITTDPKPAVQQASDEQNAKGSQEPVVSQTDSSVESSHKSSAAPPTGKTDDGTKLYGTVIKSWTSGGVGGTGAQSATVIARYRVSKDNTTGLVDFASSTFELEFIDVDNQTTSTIPAYAFKFTGPTQIPQPSDGGVFQLNGTVLVSSQSSGRLLFVDFDMSGDASDDAGSTPKSIGSIFQLNIPSDTNFAPLNSTPTV